MRRVMVRTGFSLFLVAAASCGGSPAPTNDLGGDNWPPGQRVPAIYIELLGPQKASQLADLQLAIDTVVEGEVAKCMAAEGLHYTPRSQAELLARDTERENQPLLNYAEQAMATISGSKAVEQGANHNERSRLAPAEREAWDKAENRCFVEASALHENPLVLEGTWIDIATSIASEKTGADPRVRAAQLQLDLCFETGGFGSIQEATSDFSEAALSLQADLWNGMIAREVALLRLRQLAAQEAMASALLRDCLRPYSELERDVFSEHMLDIASREAEAAARWASEISDWMQPYLDFLPKQT